MSGLPLSLGPQACAPLFSLYVCWVFLPGDHVLCEASTSCFPATSAPRVAGVAMVPILTLVPCIFLAWGPRVV